MKKQIYLDEHDVLHDEGIYFISVFINKLLYAQCVSENQYIVNNSNCHCVAYDNRSENTFISRRYNEFLDSYHYEKEAWFIFCHSDWEILADPSLVVSKLDKEKIYGPIGAILDATPSGAIIREYKGQCYEKRRDGSNERLLLCEKTEAGEIVDTLDAQCLIIHSSLVKKYALRFDPRFEFDLYVEDFCVTADKLYNIPTCIGAIPCCHWNQLDSMDGREAYYTHLPYLNSKHKEKLYAGVVSLLGGEGKFQIVGNKIPQIIYT